MNLRVGFRCTVLALLTMFLFALSVFSFIETATAPGYWAVVLFLAAVVLMGWAVILLYAQGFIHAERRGESK